jgi:hypothetical protein
VCLAATELVMQATRFESTEAAAASFDAASVTGAFNNNQ